MEEEFRVIPGYDHYGASRRGAIKSFERDLILRQYLLNGYLFVDAFRGSLTETLPVHRAVALAWVENLNPEAFTIVNHRDGIPLNNWYTNLEWTDHSGNNYHAVANGLRLDNITCRVRNFYTKVEIEFPSMAQAAEYMGLKKDAPIAQLCPKKFGALIADRFEFRFADDPTPWFYEFRSERVMPSRYLVTIKDSNGDTRELYSGSDLLKGYQLYGCPQGISVPALVAYGNQLHPDKVFTFRDSYTEEQFRRVRNTRPSETVSVRALKDEVVEDFDSLTQCAKHFNVDRSSIINRLNNGKELDGWTFIQLPL